MSSVSWKGTVEALPEALCSCSCQKAEETSDGRSERPFVLGNSCDALVYVGDCWAHVQNVFLIQDRHRAYDVTPWCVRITIVAVGRQQCILCFPPQTSNKRQGFLGGGGRRGVIQDKARVLTISTSLD